MCVPKPGRIFFYCQSSELAYWIMKYVIQGTTRKPELPCCTTNHPSSPLPTLGFTALYYVCMSVSFRRLQISSSSSVPVSSSDYSIYTEWSPDFNRFLWMGTLLYPKTLLPLKQSSFFLPKQMSSEIFSTPSTPTPWNKTECSCTFS